MTEQQEPLGYPCKLMIWNKDGYHKCKGFPTFDNGEAYDSYALGQFVGHTPKHKPKIDYCVCYYVGGAFVDCLTESFEAYEANAQKECPLGLSWKQMEAKIGPAVARAIAQSKTAEDLSWELCGNESISWFLKQRLLYGLSKKDLIEKRLQGKNFPKEYKNVSFDKIFDLVSEVAVMAWQTHYCRGLNISKDELAERTHRLGLLNFWKAETDAKKDAEVQEIIKQVKDAIEKKGWRFPKP